jgi:hypothetical protein
VDQGVEPALVLDLVEAQLPHVEVHGLSQAPSLQQFQVVGVVPALEDQRLALVALDQQAALVVGREVHRADHAVAAPVAQPVPRGVEQGRGRLGIVLALEEPEQAPVVALELVEVMVDVGADPPDRLPVAQRQEELGLRVVEERILPAIEECPALGDERWDPVRLVTIEPHRKLYEAREVAPGCDRLDLDRHPRQPNGNG